MVEGHSVHRVAVLHRQRLVGKTFKAWSPNGRFKEGASAIDGKRFRSIEAVGKNLFAFFGSEKDPVVVHVHFGMSGNWAVYEDITPPEPTSTNRLRLECPGLVADLSAMTVQHGGMNLYESKRAKLGEDPLRDDADPEKLWQRVQNSRKSIGALIMDQSFFTGPGNIYRAEILFKARIHPDVPGNELTKSEFDTIWKHTVALLKRGFETGSILTVDPEDARAFGKPKLRRYIYNSAKCPCCNTAILVWQIASRTCYACPSCQPRSRTKIAIVTPEKACVPFISRCAPESVMERIQSGGTLRLTVKELRAELQKIGATVPARASKEQLAEMLKTELESQAVFVSPEDAAAEKAYAGESLAVEHVAELAPGQARKAREKAKKVIIESDYSDLSVVQLKQKLRESGHNFPVKATKAVLIELLKANEGGDKDLVPMVATSATASLLDLCDETSTKQNSKRKTRSGTIIRQRRAKTRRI